MKEVVNVFTVALIAVVLIPVAFYAGSKHSDNYDTSDTIYKFIPEAPQDWIDKFGQSERTRLMHSISELRVVVQEQSKHIIAIESILQKEGIVKDVNDLIVTVPKE